MSAHDHGEFDADYWEDRYRNGIGASRSEPSPSLLSEAADLAPGTALDAGCGWGADALWLAARGWTVTAVDVSPSAVGQAQQHAEAADPEAAARVTWLPADLTTWQPEGQFDLVTSHYVHVPGPQEELFARLASWVAPGGTLLVVGHSHTPGHHRSGDEGSGHHDPGHHDPGHHDSGHHDSGHHDPGHEGAGHHSSGPHDQSHGDGSPPDTARVHLVQITSALPEDEWVIAAAGPRTHTISRPDGGPPAVLDDVLVRARRL